LQYIPERKMHQPDERKVLHKVILFGLAPGMSEREGEKKR